MKVAFACPKCEATSQAEFTAATAELRCTHCGGAQPLPENALDRDSLQRCLVCGSSELFVRKDFSQRLGVGIIVLGFVVSTIFWAYYMRYAAYATLFATALFDFVMYFCVGNLLQCYRCHAEYRGMPGLEKYEPFNLEVHERYRQQAIRLKEAERAAAWSSSSSAAESTQP